MYEYYADIVSVYDGDTVTAEVDLGFKIKVTEKLRLAGINAPEMRGPEKEAGKVSRDALREKILGKRVRVFTNKDKKGKYGRYIATITIADTPSGMGIVHEDVNKWMVENGYAVEAKY